MTRFADYRAALHALLQARTSLSAAQVNYSRPKLSESDRRIYIDDVMTGEIETQQVLSGTLHLTETVTFVVVVVAHGSDQTQAELDQTVQTDTAEVLAAIATIDRATPLTDDVKRVTVEGLRLVSGPGEAAGAYQARMELEVVVRGVVTAGGS